MEDIVLGAVAANSLAGTALAQEPVWDGNTVVLESQKIADGAVSDGGPAFSPQFTAS